jgi:ubiquinone/menaquinone biosynthesis C-methylase UbiE
MSRPHDEGEAAYKEIVRAQWNKAAPSWHRWTPMMRAQYAPATELMLDLAKIGPGSHVLDVAAGDGYPSMLAAQRVGSGGSVLAIDLAEEQLGFAEAAAAEANLENFHTRVMDGEHLDFPSESFDAVICHFGLMFFHKPERALMEIWRVLRPGGSISTVNYAAEGSPESTLASEIIRKHVGDGLDEPERLSGGNLGAPGALQHLFEAAGFGAIEVHALSLPLRLKSAAEARSYLQEAYPSLGEMIAPLTSEERGRAWAEIEAAFSAFEGPGGLEIPNKFLVVAGSKI